MQNQGFILLGLFNFKLRWRDCISRLLGKFIMFTFNDGGRQAAGFKGTAGDCVVRAISIAMNLDYKTTYKQLAQLNKDFGNAKSARNGLNKKVYIPFLEQHGWKWVSAPKFEGRKARCADMPKGIVIARQAHHLVAVIDGVPNDVFNPSHKMVYGYWAKQ